MNLNGSCHCGNVSFQLNLAPGQIQARACDCSFCTRHGALWAAPAGSELTISVRSPEHMTDYRFGTETASFHLCQRCGCVPVVTSQVEGRLYAVVNVNCLADLDPDRLSRAAVSLEGEDEASRLARRQRNWIAKVSFGQAT